MPAFSKQKKTLTSASLLDKKQTDQKEVKKTTKKRSREEDSEAKNTFDALAPAKKAKTSEESGDQVFVKPSMAAPRRVASQDQQSETSKPSKKKSSSNSSVKLSDSESDYPSVPSTPNESSELSFTSDFSDSDDEPASSSVDEFATNKLEISLDAATTQKLKDKVAGHQKKQTLDKQIEREMNKDDNLGVICLSHIPYGFYEDQMKQFFAQFGTVTRLRLSRSKRSARSRGYAFIEFDDREVAAIVAETMNDYLMYGRRLKCEVVPPEKVHPMTFAGSRKPREPRAQANYLKHRLSHNRTRSQKEVDAQVKKILEKEEKRRQKLAAAGIEYEFDGFSAQAPTTAETPAKVPMPDLSSLSAKKSPKAKK